MHRIYDLLKRDGILIITTIDTKGILPFYSLKPPEHLFYFSHYNLKYLLKLLKYHIVNVKPHFLKYRACDLFYRLYQFSKYKGFNYLSNMFSKKFPHFSLRILTNEMIIIAKKQY